MEMAKVTSKGQITIPISIRRKLEINEGDKILFISKSDGVMMVNPDTLQSGQLDELTKQAEAASEKKAPAKAKQKPAAAKKAEKAEATTAPVKEQTPKEVPQAAPPEAPVPAPVKVEKKAPIPADVLAPSPPPAKISDEAAEKVAGLDLGSLLDDIRSIGSNISNN